MNYELNQGVPAIAVGLSAISFSASLQKDAAPIPNALAAIKTRNILKIQESVNSRNPLRRHRGDVSTKNHNFEDSFNNKLERLSLAISIV